ncbi:MAG TPA: HAD family phosphatase [Candidatus Saccharimonadales bacterium]|jgi:epoxide hydrolase-like predicted phosphatase
MYKAVIFDFFDVIHRDYQKAWLKQHGYKREGGFAEASDLCDLGHISYRDYIERFAKLGGQTPAQVEQEFRTLSKIDDAIVLLVGNLHSHYRTGLISNAHNEEIRPILERHDLTALFDEIVISSEAGVTKPNARIFQLTMKLLKIKPSETIFIDDNPANVVAADALGIASICYESAPKLHSELKKLKMKID